MICARVSSRAMDGAGGAVLLLCPRFNFQKLFLGDFAGAAEKGFCSPFSIFLPQPTGRVAHGGSWHIPATSADGLTTSGDIRFSRLKIAAKEVETVHLVSKKSLYDHKKREWFACLLLTDGEETQEYS